MVKVFPDDDVHGDEDLTKKNVAKRRWINIGFIFVILVTIVVSISLSAYFFVQFLLLEIDYNNHAVADVSKETKKLILDDIGLIRRSVLSILAFYEGSTYVDYQEFNTFHSIIDVDPKITADLSWLVLIPQPREVNFHKTIANLKLPAARQLTLNTTVLANVKNHFLVSYIEPYEYTQFGENLGTSDYSDLLLRVLENKKAEYRVDFALKYLELYVPVTKSALADSLLIKDNQNGLIRGRFKLNTIVEEGFTFHSDKCDYGVYFQGQLVHSSTKSAEIEKRKKDTYDVDLGYEANFQVTVSPKSNLFRSSYKVLKYVFMFVPLLIGSLCVVMLIIGGNRFNNYLISKEEMKTMQTVAEAISRMKFDHPLIQNLANQKIKKRGLKKTMRNIVIQMKEYRKYMPQTLLNQMVERFSSRQSIDVSTGGSDAGLEDKKTKNKDGSKKKKNEDVEYDSSQGSSIDSVNSDSDIRSASSKNSSKKDRHSDSCTSPISGGTSNYKHRHVVMMFVYVANMEDKFRQYKKMRKLDMFKKIVQNSLSRIFEYCCVQCGGSFHGISGGVFQVSWNAVTVKVDRCLSALRAGWDVICDGYFGDNNLDVRVGIASGESMNGTFSLEKHNIKQFDSVGYVVELARRLMCMNAYYGTRILIDDYIGSNCQFSAKMRMVDHWKFKKYRKVKIYELLGVRENNDDEWMYEIGTEDLDEDDGSVKKALEEQVTDIINTCWDEIVRGDLQSAKRRGDEFLKSLGNEKKKKCEGAFGLIFRVCEEKGGEGNYCVSGKVGVKKYSRIVV